MPIQQQFCANHPQRAAIGICVMTRKPICGECSTRYEGVNYSREGLELLRKQQAAAVKKQGRGMVWGTLAWLAAPILLFLMYAAYWSAATVLMDLWRPKGS
jgi:hypothetical protein